MTAMETQVAAELSSTVRRLVGDFITFLETGEVAHDLFASDIFADISMPTWRVQAGDLDALVRIRRIDHSMPGQVVSHRADPIPAGFVLEFEEQWQHEGGRWRARELVRAEVRDGSIAELTVYCTGDWSPQRIVEHAATVALLRA